MKKNLNIAYLNGANIGKKVINVVETINNQDKDINITENGSVEVVADNGYTGLGKVTVNVEVVSSGDGSGSGEASNIEYLDVSGVNQEIYFASLLIMSFVSKNKENGVVGITPSAAMVGYNNSLIISLAIDFSFKTSNGTILELLLNIGITQEQLDAIPRITKEQFYSLE